MDATRWKQLSPLLDVLLELDADAREQRLQELHAQDPELSDDLRRLLALEEGNTDFIAEPMLSRPEHALVGTLVGPYLLDTQLGEGGMGSVWLASRADGLYQRRIALKLLRPGLVDPGLQLRFAREREILARLEHPNIARLLDAGISQHDQSYLALEYVEGRPITDYCRNRNVDINSCLRLFLQVCEAVSHAHANLIVHRDLKPSNILVTDNGEARLLDFGIAKLLDAQDEAASHPRTEVRAFTLHYAAPEQIRGDPVSTRTDVYSLGVVLYELLTCKKPYRLRRQTDAEWEEAILAVDPLKPSVAVQRDAPTDSQQALDVRRQARQLRGDLDNIVLKALAKDPGQRYSSVEAMARDLQRYLEGRPVHARPLSFGYRLRKYVLRQRWALVAGSLVAVSLISALGISLWQGRQARMQAVRAQAMQDFVIGLFDSASNTQQGQMFDAQRMLDAGLRRGEKELAGQPLAHAELLGVVARLRLGLGKYHDALDTLEKQQGLLQSLGSPPVGLQMQSIALHGRTLRLLDRADECIALMNAPGLQRQLPRIPEPEQAEFLSQLGRCLRISGQPQVAQPLFEKSLALRERNGDLAGVAENRYDLAMSDNNLGLSARAMTGFNASLEMLRAAGDDHNPLAIPILHSRGLLLRRRGDTEAAAASLQQALVLAESIHGPQHPVTLSTRRQLVALETDMERYAEAERQMRELHRLTVQSLGPQHRDTGSSWNTLGIIAWERGRIDEAIRDISNAIDIWRGPDGSQSLPGGLFNLGMVLHSAGREDEALNALQEARMLRAARYGSSSAVIGETDRMIGEVLAAQGKTREANEYLQRAVDLTRVGYGPNHPRTLASRLSLARQQGRSGQPEPALHELQQLADWPGTGSEVPKLRWEARAYLAELQCRNGQAASARRDLDQLVDELHRLRPDGGVISREAEAIRAACRR
ncbi:hypothetical protein CSC70_02630 [Pseudoxanthomonas kalamensis DSM 18571]|uniref:serine/threonine-protein kinase n=1 Tax=Pseudoxanthomonas kalamensis TaxID=289483 RepID=UPI001390993F|nr:serine/threonine-protein kinase [Pseudoxanthomonas kalamensis]KAF1712435.1 hypothetical protein CSC70_02630 [Pseudoxanthomonas kalamensis DSM 18571]